MNAIKRKILAISVLALCAVGLAFFILSGPEKDDANVTDDTAAASPRKAKRQQRMARKEHGAQRLKQKEKPTINLDDKEYEGLSNEMRAILKELEAALDNDDDKGVARTCAKILKIMREKGEDAVPPVVREDAVEALGLSLPAALPELMGFMADSNEDVREAVNDQLDELFGDPTIGDANLAPIITTLSKIVTDEDLIDSMVMSLESDLRNSVKVATYKQILKTGTEEVKEKVRESIDDLLDVDEAILTDAQREAGLDKYLREEPDDEDDDDLYGANDLDSDND